jgi:hypothetical protein
MNRRAAPALNKQVSSSTYDNRDATRGFWLSPGLAVSAEACVASLSFSPAGELADRGRPELGQQLRAVELGLAELGVELGLVTVCAASFGRPSLRASGLGLWRGPRR